MNERIKEKFDIIAEKYDSQRRYLIPCLDDFYSITTELLELENDSPSILDMGAGTGLLTYYIYQKYKNASYTLIDLSSEMLKIAEERFANLSNFEFITRDYINYIYGKDYNAVVSALSIHHLSDEDKQSVYNKAYNILKSGGIFINADQVLGSSDEAETINRKNWIKRIEGSSLNQQEKQSAYNRMELDRMATLDKNIEMIKSSGFKTVEVYYKYYNFSVIYAKKY